MELLAIEKAIEQAETIGMKNPIIFTDSLAGCEILKKAKNEEELEKIIYNIHKKGKKGRKYGGYPHMSE